MPLLGGIFGKKNKSSARNDRDASHGPASIAPSDLDSVLSSPTTSYVTTEKSLPSSPNGKNSLSPATTRTNSSQVYPSIVGNPSASSSRLRLPFTRKKQKSPAADAGSTFSTSPNPSSVQPPRPPYAARSSTSAASDTDATDTRRLRPPPSKSAIFAAYADPSNALSSHSLPDESMQLWSSMSSPSTPPKPPSKEKEKRPSLFSWTKSSPSSGITKPPAPEQSKPPKLMDLDSPPRLDLDSFNLKSFRHVRPPSPSASTSSLVVPPARPRGASVNSDSSQRISVAAFREAQARRSTAGSPVPSFRSPSPSLPTPGFPQDGQRGRASPRPSPAANQSHLSPHLRNGAYHQKRRSTSLAVGYTSESEESTTASEEEESDDEGTDVGRNGRVHRDGTITPRTRPLIGRQAKSEIGHGSTSYDSPTSFSSRPSPGFPATRSQSGHGQGDESVRQNSYAANPRHSPVETPPPRSNSSLDMYGGAARPRASASTSALSPSAAAKRASILVNANAGLNQDPLAEAKQATRHVRHSSTHSNPASSQPQSKHIGSDTSDSDSDSDNAPLAALVPPRRPGSALSQASNASLRTNGTRGPAGRGMAKPLIDINELTNKRPSVGPYKGDDDGFTKGGLLASRLSPSEGPGVLVESPTSAGFLSSPSSGSSGLSGVTSKATPNFTSFVPPTSPPKEVQAYANLDARSITAPSRPQPQPVQQSDTGKEKESSPERRRDGLTERLAKLAKGKGKDSIDASTSLGLGEVMRSTSPPPSQQHHVPQTRPESPSKRSTPKLSIPSTGASSKPSPPDDELIHDVDDSILRLISRMGDSDADMSLAPTPATTATATTTTQGEEDEDDTTSESESDTYGEPERKKSVKDEKEKAETSWLEMPEMPSFEKGTDRIAPIPIKQREPPSSFSVMSRPPFNKPSGDDLRSTLTTTSLNTIANAKANTTFNTSSAGSSATLDSPSITSNFKSNSTLNSLASSTTGSSNTTRKRSSTLIPSSTTLVPATSSSSSSTFGASTSSFAKLNVSSRGGSSVASSSNASSTGASSPKSGSANADRAKALKTVASGVGARSAVAVDSAYPLRQRSSTMVPMMPSPTSSQNKISPRAPITSAVPVKPFAVRRDSPASSTGDSSSSRAPLTPRDGSDVGSSKTAPSGKKKDEWSSGVSGLSVTNTKSGMRSRGVSNGPGSNRHVQRRSVSFNDDVRDEDGKSEAEEDDAETRRKERRRSEAKAAIELGNVINGPGPIVSDDEDDLPINKAVNVRMNPMMAMGNQLSMQMPFSGAPGSPAGWGGNLPLTAWPQGGPPQMPQMLAQPQFMVPTAGPNYMAAHQQAMMFAKQAYQMAVAQQAMAAAADEWDRSSVMGGSVYGGPSSNASVMMGPSPFNMMSGMGNGWSPGAVIFPNSTQSVYGGMGGLGSSRSEYGGGGSVASMTGGKWSSARSTYGDAFGPSDRSRPGGGGGGGGGNRNSTAMRDSGYYPPVPPIPQSSSGASSSSGARGRGRTSSGPATPSRGTRKAPPPSSWKAGV